MKILVTGATGFIGNHVVNSLLKSGCNVIAAARHIQRAKKMNWFPDVEFRRLDTSAPHENPFVAMGSPDRMIHLAWEELTNYNSTIHLQKNLPDNIKFLSLMIKGGLKHMLVAGTCFEYGLQEGELSEEMPTKPFTAYGKAKDQLRQNLESQFSEPETILQWARIFYLHGDGQGKKSLFAQLKQAIDNNDPVFSMSGGEQVRDYLSVKIAADHLTRIVLQDKVNGVINVCSGKPKTIKKQVEAYLKLHSSPMNLNLGHYPYPDWEPFKFWGSTAKLKRAIHVTR